MGVPLQATSFSPSILLFSLPCIPQGVWAEPAQPLPNVLMQFMQSNSFIKFTLMFNVGYYINQRECRVQPLLAELILWTTGHVWH